MRTNDDRNWELIESALAAESSGKSPRLFSSRRTLFGIPSALDQEMAQLEAKATKSSKRSSGTAKTDPDERDVPDEKSAAHREGPGLQLEATQASGGAARPSLAASSGKAAGRRRAGGAQRVAHPLNPVFDERSRVLILGTMPSPKSRETGFYYNHPQNRFWKVLAALFDEPIPATNREKEALARAHGIALWDVLAECSIEGAADGTIAECVPNDIAWLLGESPIEAVFCTGAKATELYQKYCEPACGRTCTRLPSTSPANAAVSLDQLIEAYRVILPHCR